MLAGWGLGRMPRRQLHFRELQLGGSLTVIAGADNCWGFSVRGIWGLSRQTFSSMPGVYVYISKHVASQEWKGIRNVQCWEQHWNPKVESSWLTWDHLRGSLYKALMDLSENAITESYVCVSYTCMCYIMCVCFMCTSYISHMHGFH